MQQITLQLMSEILRHFNFLLGQMPIHEVYMDRVLGKGDEKNFLTLIWCNLQIFQFARLLQQTQAESFELHLEKMAKRLRFYKYYI